MPRFCWYVFGELFCVDVNKSKSRMTVSSGADFLKHPRFIDFDLGVVVPRLQSPSLGSSTAEIASAIFFRLG